MKYNLVGSPDFMEDLVVYELCTKQFTTPGGVQSGNFRTTAEKMPYLKELGINGIWLNGHSLCNTVHGGVWCQYATVRPDKLDPSLGTEEDFQLLVDKAHENGIYIFLDVITHGVVPESDLLVTHPEWFSGGSWGMIDYDWYGDHPDREAWWIQTWVDYVVKYDIDGYRLDVAHYHDYLWAEVRKRCAAAGKVIMVMMENGPAIPGVSDTLQHSERLSDNRRFYPEHRILKDCAGHFLDRQYNRNEQYTVKIFYKDGTSNATYREERMVHDFSVDLLQASQGDSYIRHVDNERYQVGYEEEMGVLLVENVADKEIEDIHIFDFESHRWNYDLSKTLEVDYYIEVKGAAPSLELHFPIRQMRGQYISNQLSCHDNGWEGYPLDQDPFVAKGSRHVMGYGCLLTPAIPLFMSGEEFDLSYTTVVGQADQRHARMLQFAVIDWAELEQPSKKAMLEDTKKMLKIRRENRHLIKALQMGVPGNVQRVYAKAEKPLPIPYMYTGQGSDGRFEAIIVAGNPSADEAATLSFALSDVLQAGSYKAEVLYGSRRESLQASAEELSRQIFEIGKDKTPEGGLLVIKLSATSA